MHTTIYEESAVNLGNVSRDELYIAAVEQLNQKYNAKELDFLTMPDMQNPRILGMDRKQKAEFIAHRVTDCLHKIEISLLVNELLSADRQIVALDNNWRQKASSYISHIRDAVSKADMQEPLRERILSRLNELQKEIDRNRTRVEAVTDVWLSLAEATSMGAKHLEGTLKLIERLAGAFSTAKRIRIGQETRLALPAPEELGLSELGE